MSIRAGARVDAVDFDLPDPAVGAGSGTNTITSTTFANLPTSTSVSITNPHPSAAMLCLVTLGAWMQADTNAVRAAIAVSGSTTIVAGIGGGGAAGWGEVLRCPVLSVTMQMSTSWTVELPASTTAATFTVQAYREAGSGTQQVNYPTLRVVPLRFLV